MSNKFFKIYLLTLLIITIYSQLSILSPYNLVQQLYNKQIEMAYGKVGNLNDFYIRGQLYMETKKENRDACSPLTELDLIRKNDTIYDENFIILLAYRGSCSFAQKARNAQRAGASMLIVINIGNTPINNVIFTDDSNDIFIPVTLINNSDGKLLEDYIKLNPTTKILAEVSFTPKKEKKVVDFKFFFSSSEPRAYDLIGNMTKYISKFDKQINFIPHYVVHKNPYNPQSNINCLSRGEYCYFPKETTIIQEGQNILLEDIRQKCIYQLSKEKSLLLYYDYMKTFSKDCINSQVKSFNNVCSKNSLVKLGYPDTYLDKCIANSFDISVNELFSHSYIDRNNTILKEEYDEILKYKLTSFPAIIINDKVMSGLIKEDKIVSELCNSVKVKPSFCPESIMIGKRRNYIIYFSIFALIIINIFLFFMCKAYVNEILSKRVKSDSIDIDGRISNVINNYFALQSTSNDYKAFEPKNSNNTSNAIEMQEGKVSTI